jgi:hypothetical protein
MTGALSRFRTGDIVEVRSREEILATLDREGRLQGMPFMPEMLQYCGRRFRVSAVAHKTCETVQHTLKARRIETTVHLAGLRCDGSAHGGCQAQCNLYWKDSWLKPSKAGRDSSSPMAAASASLSGVQSVDQLLTTTRLPGNDGHQEPRYSCQATRLYEATEALSWWDPRQYIRDVITRNFSIRHVLRVLCLAFVKHCHQRAPIGYRLTKLFRERLHLLLTGREIPDFCGSIGLNERTPGGRLGLKPGELVRIKSKEEIVTTLNKKGKNRGLYFDVELSPYCGRVATVRSSVTQIIDEPTGKMRQMKEPCIMLEGVVCNSEYSEGRLMCPRAVHIYWREIWLDRLEEHPPGPRA